MYYGISRILNTRILTCKTWTILKIKNKSLHQHSHMTFQMWNSNVETPTFHLIDGVAPKISCLLNWMMLRMILSKRDLSKCGNWLTNDVSAYILPNLGLDYHPSDRLVLYDFIRHLKSCYKIAKSITLLNWSYNKMSVHHLTQHAHWNVRIILVYMYE